MHSLIFWSRYEMRFSFIVNVSDEVQWKVLNMHRKILDTSLFILVILLLQCNSPSKNHLENRKSEVMLKIWFISSYKFVNYFLKSTSMLFSKRLLNVIAFWLKLVLCVQLHVDMDPAKTEWYSCCHRKVGGATDM